MHRWFSQSRTVISGKAINFLIIDTPEVGGRPRSPCSRDDCDHGVKVAVRVICEVTCYN